MRRWNILLSFTLLLSGVVTAQEYKDTLQLREVTVSAPAKTKVELTPLTVSIVNESTIQESTQSSLLPVLQNHIPGFFVSERGFAGYGVSGGAAGSVSIRGVGQGNKILFMIDGMPQFAGIFGHALPDTYVANGVDHVEVVRGPSSLLYGSNAMGGSVNIITKSANKDGVKGRARAMFGSFSTQKFNTSVSFKKGKFGFTAAGQLDRSNGYRANSEFWLANEYIQSHYEFNNNWNVGANLDMTQTKANNPGTIQEPLIEMWTRLFRGTSSVYVHNNYSRLNGGIQAYINWGSNHVDDGHAPNADPRNYIFRSTDYNMGVTAFETIKPWVGNDLSIGLDFVHWGGHSWNVLKENGEETGTFRNHENEFAAYLMTQQSLFADILSLNAGVRLQHSSQYGNEWIPQAGFVLKPVNTSSIKFSFGKGFRAPNLRELYLYAPANPDLKPEYLYNYELEYRQYLLSNKLNFGISLYFIDGKDMIQTQMIDGRPKNMNTGKFHNKGFELDLNYRIDAKWNVTANYSYLHTDGEILYAPKNKFSLMLNFNPGHWNFSVENNAIWGLLTGGPLKSNYDLLNLRAGYTLTTNPVVPITFFVKADNLTNKHYEIQYGCPMPGATILGGVDFSF